MKIVLFFEGMERGKATEVVEHFLAYGYDDIILYAKNARDYFSKIELSYYSTNGVKITPINCLEGEGTSQRLLFIKGSLNDTFLLVYSEDIISCDMDMLYQTHKNEGNLATTLVYKDRMVACMLENEIFDYALDGFNFEKEVLERVGQDLELNQIMT